MRILRYSFVSWFNLSAGRSQLKVTVGVMDDEPVLDFRERVFYFY
jgi:hypothetical protein